jgi:uncharacterized membrane protein YeaQ/YmgE (transglycosylase-associated protein family)
VGGFIAGHIGLAPSGGFLYTILIAVGGAVILVALVRLIKR